MHYFSGITTFCCKCILATVLPAPHPHDAVPAQYVPPLHTRLSPMGALGTNTKPTPPMLARIAFASTHLRHIPGMWNIRFSPAPVNAAACKAAAVISYRSNLASHFFREYIAEVSLISLTAVCPLRSLHNLWPKMIYLALFICPLKCLDSPSVDPVKEGQKFSNRFTTPPARTLLRGKLCISSLDTARPPGLATRCNLLQDKRH